MSNAVTIVIYIMLVLAVLGGIGAIAYFTAGFTTSIKPFYVEYDGKMMANDTEDVQISTTKRETFEVKWLTGKTQSYMVQVVPCIAHDNDFEYFVDGDSRKYSDLGDLTPYFDVEASSEGFSIQGTTMYNLLCQAHPDCEITMPEGLQYGCDYYTIIVSTKDMKSSIKIGIHGNDTGHVILDPEEMVF